LETEEVGHRHVAQKFPGGPCKFKEISRISRRFLNSSRFPGAVDTLTCLCVCQCVCVCNFDSKYLRN